MKTEKIQFSWKCHGMHFTHSSAEMQSKTIYRVHSVIDSLCSAAFNNAYACVIIQIWNAFHEHHDSTFHDSFKMWGAQMKSTHWNGQDFPFLHMHKQYVRHVKDDQMHHSGIYDPFHCDAYRKINSKIKCETAMEKVCAHYVDIFCVNANKNK